MNIPRPFFANRFAAGLALVPLLGHLANRQPIVLGVASGGMEVAWEVAWHLNASLDTIVARRVLVPGLPLLTVGAVASDGAVYLHPEWAIRIPADDLDVAVRLHLAGACLTERAVRGTHAALPLKRRLVIVVDDGVATGATMMACVNSVRCRGASRVVVALPVGAREAYRNLVRSSLDEVVCPYPTADFTSVSDHYHDCSAVSERRVRTLLSLAREKPAAKQIAGQGKIGPDERCPG